jgi:pyrroline-5-carboxylate reductase
MVQAFVDFAKGAGLDESLALEAVNATMIGSGHMIENFGQPDELIRQVASAKGTTEAGLMAMDDSDYDAIINTVLKAAVDRAVELSNKE